MIPKLRFTTFKEGYNTYKLGSKAEKIGSGITPKGGSAAYSNEGIPFIRSQNVNYGRLILDDTHITESQHRKMIGSRVLANDVLLNITGASIGRSCVVPSTISEANVNQHVCIIRSDKSSLSSDYLNYWLQSKYGQKEIYKGIAGGGREGLNFSSIRTFKISIPKHLEEQLSVTSLLKSLDQKINLLTKKKEALETYKKGLMQKIFSQELSFKREDGTDYPEWRKMKIGDVTICKDNKRIPLNQNERNSKKGIFPYYGANGIVDYVDEYLFDEDLVLLAEDGGFFFEFNNKPIAQLVKGKSWVNNHAHVLKAREGIIQTDYLFYSLVHRDIRRWIIGGSRVKLNKSDLLNIKIEIPTLEEQKKISSVLSTAFNQIRTLNGVIARVEELKKGLLQQMFV